MTAAVCDAPPSQTAQGNSANTSESVLNQTRAVTNRIAAKRDRRIPRVAEEGLLLRTRAESLSQCCIQIRDMKIQMYRRPVT